MVVLEAPGRAPSAEGIMAAMGLMAAEGIIAAEGEQVIVDLNST